jgi:hypothetical protein
MKNTDSSENKQQFPENFAGSGGRSATRILRGRKFADIQADNF